MKHVVMSAVCLLLLVAALAVDSDARNLPYGIFEPDHREGDDHTWGGENELAPPGPMTVREYSPEFFGSGLMWTETIVPTLVMELFFDELYTRAKTQVSSGQVITVETQTEVRDTNTKTNVIGN